MNIILCGLPMSGKTAIGRMLAERLNWNFIDTDRLVENAYTRHTDIKYTCRRIYKEKGEAFFRELEKQEIASLKSSVNSVIATGGGSLCDQKNVDALKSLGELIYLQASTHVLWQRIQAHGIPAYVDVNDPEKTFYEMSIRRIPIYEEAAHFIIKTCHLSEQDIVTLILNKRKA